MKFQYDLLYNALEQLGASPQEQLKLFEHSILEDELLIDFDDACRLVQQLEQHEWLDDAQSKAVYSVEKFIQQHEEELYVLLRQDEAIFRTEQRLVEYPFWVEIRKLSQAALHELSRARTVKSS